MTAPRHRISRRSDFSRTLKHGVRVSGRDFVVYVSQVPTEWPDPRGLRRDIAMSGGPWLGLIVSKAVGPAVTRHAVARRLRAAFAQSHHLCPAPETFVVVRAHRGAAEKSSEDFARGFTKAFADPKLVAIGASR